LAGSLRSTLVAPFAPAAADDVMPGPDVVAGTADDGAGDVDEVAGAFAAPLYKFCAHAGAAAMAAAARAAPRVRCWSRWFMAYLLRMRANGIARTSSATGAPAAGSKRMLAPSAQGVDFEPRACRCLRPACGRWAARLGAGDEPSASRASPKRVRFPIASFTVALALFGLAGCHSALPPADPRTGASFDASRVARGASLAAVGNCRGCHTRRDGPPFAGGEPMPSPFGTIYSTNITPDPESGIGRWSEEAFQRAMRKGVRRDGAHLYPAFPYDRFTRVTDEDNRSIYAYLMSLPPVRYSPPANDLAFPFNIRAGLALWNALFLREGPQPPEASNSVTLARGEYLVEGLGHCGSCHSPRNFLFAEKRDRAYDGGEAQGWHAYAINAKNAAPIPWEPEALAFYLRHGFHAQHGISRGPMGLVTGELAEAAESDVNAMAAYAASLMGPASEARRQRAASLTRDPLALAANAGREEGAVIYETTCLPCHDGRRALPFGGVPLKFSLGLHGESPRNLVNVIVHGLDPATGGTTPMMPGYAGAMSDAQIATLVSWLRASLTDKPAWSDLPALIRESREMTPAMLSFPPGGAGADPLYPTLEAR
jgi:mono/diheme cytochrome c family protein